MDFSQWLSQAIDKRGITQAQLARELGVSRQALCNWRAGRHRPSSYYIVRLVKLLEPERFGDAIIECLECLIEQDLK